MGKLTSRSPIVTADVDEDLLIHVVDTSGTPASFKATLSQLYAVFPKNSSAGASDVDYVARWTAEDELGKGIIQDDGSRVGIDTAPDAVYKLNVNGGAIISGSALVGTTNTSDRKLTLVNTAAQDTTGGNYMAFYESDQTTRRGYIGFTDADTFRIYVQDIVGTSQIILDADEIILNSTDETQSSTIKSGVWEGTAIADAYIASAATWNAKADISATPANNQVAVWTNGTTIEGDSNFTWDGFEIEVTDADNNLTEVRADWLRVYNETSDANLFLYGYGTSGSNNHRGEIVLGSANGTRGGETATVNTDTIANIYAFGHNGSSFAQGGQLLFQATQDYSGSASGTKFVIQTATNGTTTIATRYSIDGDGDHNFNGSLKVDGQAYSAIAPTVTPSLLAATIDWDNGNMQVLDLQTGGSVNTLTINNPKAGASYFIKIIQGGGNTITWPAAVKWAENDEYAGSIGVGAIDAVALTYDGSSYLANYSLDYQ